MSFREDFAKTQGGPEREQVVYRAVISQGKPKDLWPITVTAKDGSKVTYYITRDFLKVDGQYVPMTGTTAQKVADYFGMSLPTNTIADQVWKEAQKQGSAVEVHPLSGTGYRGGNGQWYSPQDVVAGRIGATDAAVDFSGKVNDAISKNPKAQTGLVDIGSGGKWLTMPPASNSLGLHGIRQGDKTIQGGYGTIHPNYEDHAEYGTYIRLVDNRVDVESPNGQKKTMTLDEFAKNADLRSTMFVDGQDFRDGGLARYDLKRDKAQLAQIDKQVGQPGQDTSQVPESIQKIDQMLQGVQTQIASRMAIYDRILKYAGFDKGDVQIMGSIGKDPAIKDLSKDSIPGHAPEGYQPLSQGEGGQAIGYAARTILENSSLGDQVPFKIGDQLYMGRSEPHFHPGPTAEEKQTMSEAALNAKYPAKPWYWHRGVTVFKAKEGTQAPSDKTEEPGENASTVSGPKGRMSLIQRIDGFLDGLNKQMG